MDRTLLVVLVVYLVGIVVDMLDSRARRMNMKSTILNAPIWPLTLLARLMNRWT